MRIYAIGEFIRSSSIDRLVLRLTSRTKIKPGSAQAGRVITILLAGITIAAALSLAPQPVAASDSTAKLYYDLTDAPTIVVDWNNGAMQTVVLADNRKFTFTGGQPGGHYLLSVTQDAHGSRTVTWPADVRWPGGVDLPPTLTTTANKTDYIGFVYSGRSKTYDMQFMSQDY
jgi:hypothetical protein